eukprot:TRINITY_DN86221_c0_g1_i1.p1 TRINITY_DN86221_c0_g1~~TRINITY_DN86221_c0_g1_i1.p1  ORF type:complete len:158 (-),score=1.60 TRINITY_DN86221_c0_g1_i1:34-507(-)
MTLHFYVPQASPPLGPPQLSRQIHLFKLLIFVAHQVMLVMRSSENFWRTCKFSPSLSSNFSLYEPSAQQDWPGPGPLLVKFAIACPFRVNQVQPGELLALDDRILISNHTVAPGMSGGSVGQGGHLVAMHMKANGGLWNMSVSHPAFQAALQFVREH